MKELVIISDRNIPRIVLQKALIVLCPITQRGEIKAYKVVKNRHNRTGILLKESLESFLEDSSMFIDYDGLLLKL